MLHNLFHKCSPVLPIPARLGMVLVLLVTALGITPVQAAPAANIVVDTAADNAIAGDSNCTLREAINNANSDSDTTSGDCTAGTGADTITFAGGISLITLNSDLPPITDAAKTTITGPGASSLSINGQDTYRPFNIASGAVVEISGLTIAEGSAQDGTDGNDGANGADDTDPGGSGGNGANGGAVTAAGNGGDGGGIHNSGDLTLIRCTIFDNAAGHGGDGGNGGTGGLGYNNGAGDGSDGGNGGNGGNAGDGGDGGGIYNAGTLVISKTTIYSNTAGNAGIAGNAGAGGVGGGAVGSTATAGDGGAGGNAGSTGDAGHGGGVYNAASGSLTMINCTISGNTAGVGGKGGNGGNGGKGGTGWSHAAGGNGGNGGTCTNGHDGGNGGGIYDASGSTATLLHCTIVDNITGDGGDAGSGGDGGGGGGGDPIGVGGASQPGCPPGNDGDGGGVYDAGGTTNVKNTILANNLIGVAFPPTGSGPDCSGTITSQDYNLIEDNTGCTIVGATGNNIYGLDPNLSALRDNGGATWTHALLPTSPAIDKVPPASSTLDDDQRDVERPLDGLDDGTAAANDGYCDIGAYEDGPPEFSLTKTVVSGSNLYPGSPGQETATFRIVACNNGGGWATGARISDTLPSQLTFADNVQLTGATGTKATVPSDLPDLVTNMSDIAIGACVTVTFEATVICTSTATVTNNTWITSTKMPTPTKDSASVTIQNIAPVANDDGSCPPGSGFITVGEDDTTASTTGDVTANDTDANCEDVDVSNSDFSSTTGIASYNGNNTYNYDPNGQFEYLAVGETACDSFRYQVTDHHGGTSGWATVRIVITGANDCPTARPDTDTTNQNTAIDIDVIAGRPVPTGHRDTDPDTNDTLTIQSVTQPLVSGTVTINTGNLTVNFDPNGDFDYLGVGDSATVTFTYTITDGQCTDTAVVTVTVTGLNDAPTANDDCDTYQTDEDTVLTVTAPGVLGNDTDPDGDPLTVDEWEYPSGPSGNANGDVRNTGSDGSFTYDPTTYYNYLDNGDEVVDYFDYRIHDGYLGYDVATVCITVTGINDPPDAVDDNTSTPEDTEVTVVVLNNDTDPEDDHTGTPLDVIAVGTCPSGTVTLNANNTVTFSPTLNFSGTACFTYTIEDSGGLTDTAWVCIDVGGVNDCPVAHDDTATTDEETAINIDVLANDIDPDSTLTVQSVTQPISGSVTNNGTDVTFNPGTDFQYLAQGESVDVTFTYIATDGQCTDTATVTVTVTGVNDGPTANDDGPYTVLEDHVLTVPADGVLGNDTDPDTSDTLTVNTTPATPPAHGTLALHADGSFVYTPTEHYFGSDSFVYTVDDGNGGTDNGTVNITVTPVNDEPSFDKGPDVTVDEDSGAYTGGAGWATNIYPGPTTVSAPWDESSQTVHFNVTNNTNPSLFSSGPSINSSGDLSFTPAGDACGSAQITIELQDDGLTANGGDDTSPTQTFTITVTCINDAPSFTEHDVTRDEDCGAQHIAPWATGISAGPTNESGQSLTFSVENVSNPGLFSAGPTVDNSGNLDFTPADDMYGSSQVAVKLQDNGGTANGGDDDVEHTFTITINPVNDEPTFGLPVTDVIVNEDSGPHNESGWLTNVYRGPTAAIGAPWDESGQTLTYHVNSYDCGSLACNELFSSLPSISGGSANPTSGDLDFTPALNMYGVAHVQVYITDDGGTANNGDDTSVTREFTITVRSVNDEPGFTKGADVQWGTNAGPYILGAGWATNILKGPDPATWGAPYNETSQEVTFNLSYVCDDNCGNNCGNLFDTLPDISDSLSPPSGTLTFEPHGGCWGTAYVTVTIQDDGGTDWGGDDESDEQYFIIRITQNARPIAENDSAVTDEATPWEIYVLDNDWDPDTGPGPLSITTVGTPEWGQAVLSRTTGLSDTVFYTPTVRPFTYVDVFTYTINDTISDSLPAEVRVVIGDEVDREVTPGTGGGLFYTGVQTCTESGESMPISTTVEVPPGAVADTVALVYSELPLDILNYPGFQVPSAPPGLGFATRLFQLDVYSNAVRQEVGQGYTFIAPITITLVNVCCQGGMTLSYWDEQLQTWSTDGITVIEEDIQNGRLVVTTNRLGLVFALACKPWPPVGGYTEPLSAPALLWPGITLVLLVGVAIMATALKRRKEWERTADPKFP